MSRRVRKLLAVAAGQVQGASEAGRSGNSARRSCSACGGTFLPGQGAGSGPFAFWHVPAPLAVSHEHVLYRFTIDATVLA